MTRSMARIISLFALMAALARHAFAAYDDMRETVLDCHYESNFVEGARGLGHSQHDVWLTFGPRAKEFDLCTEKSVTTLKQIIQVADPDGLSKISEPEVDSKTGRCVLHATGRNLKTLFSLLGCPIDGLPLLEEWCVS